MEAATAAIPTEKVTGDVTVLEVGEGRRPWESAAKEADGDKPARPAGKFIGYRVKLRLHAAGDVEVDNVEVNTKADSPKFMEAGDKEFGVFDPRPGNQHGPRFQKKNPQGGGGGRGRGGPSPLEQCRMQRQHSQMVAVDFAAKAGWLDEIEPDDSGKERINELVGKAGGPLTWLIDLFDFDIDRGAKIALERRKQDGSIGQ